MSAWVIWLGQAKKEDIPTVGGKGASLSEMVRQGLPVPPGFVLATEAYRSFVASHGLQAEIDRLAGEARPEQPNSVEEASAAIRGLFVQKTIPEGIRNSIVEAYASLGEGPVAVRSSATAEDLPETSFAGQQETYLNIQGDQAVLDGIRNCWSSLWTARAIAYRARQEISTADVSIAVVVQRLVPSEISGILFTANPVNGRRDQIVVDAAWGLGEAVVSGQVMPDHWVLDGPTGTVLEAHPGRKEVMTVRTDGGTALLPVGPDDQERQSLDGAELNALAEMGRKAAAHFGLPQDIEWAIEGGRLYLLQSRPITSLFPLPLPDPPTGSGLRVYVCVNYLQGFPEPLTPMGIALFRNLSRGVAAVLGTKLPPGKAPGAFKTSAGRMYIDATPALRHPRSRVAVLAIPGILDRPMSEIFRLLLKREPSLSPQHPRFPVELSPAFLLRLFSRVLQSMAVPARGRRTARNAAEAYISRVQQDASRVKGIEERLKFLEGQDAMSFFKVWVIDMAAPILQPAMASRFLAESKLRKWLGDASGLQPVLRSLPYNPTTEMDLALWELSRELKVEGSAPSIDHPAIRAFLDKYGHRGVREIDVGMSRWRDDPTPVLEVLRNYISHGKESDPLAQFRRGEEEAERTASDLVDQVRRKKGLLRAMFLRLLISRIRALLGMREYPKFMAMKLFAIYRDLLTGAGRELVASGRLDRAEDVFFLDLMDLTSDRDLRELAETNRAEYQRELRRRAVPRVVTSTGEVFYGMAVAQAGALVGTPASPGIYEGTVRVIRDPRGAQLEHGEVLVAPGTDPAWTPLFLTAGALVMEIGGIMSHGSVVAREYGIPAVVGVAGATEQLKTGRRVRVDGESGQVVPLD